MSNITGMAGWLMPAHKQWEKGQKNLAIQSLLQKINQKNVPPNTGLKVQLGFYLFLLNDFKSASTIFAHAHKEKPNNIEILLNLAASLSRAKNYQEAINYLSNASMTKTLASKHLAQDILCGCNAKLKNWEQAKEAGEKSLFIKHKNASNRKVSLNQDQKNDTLKDNNRKNVIAFSLWGTNPRYLRGALDNVIQCKSIYPDWQCRFYSDGSTPEPLLNTLKELGAEIILETDKQSLKEKLTWRFQVAYDQKVKRYLIRDVDSVVNNREAQAVNKWLTSDKSFHVMRDWWTHTDLILAGMWGGIANAIPNFKNRLDKYQPTSLQTPNIDQWFLRDAIWPYIYNDCLIHDRFFSSYGSQEWPTTAEENYHVGQDFFTAHFDEQEHRLKEWIEKLDCLKLP